MGFCSVASPERRLSGVGEDLHPQGEAGLVANRLARRPSGSRGKSLHHRVGVGTTR